MLQDTIAAISTGMTNSGIGIVRMSGEEAFVIAQRLFFPKCEKKVMELPSHTIHYGVVMDGDEVIDEALLSVFRAPKSYTAEDTVEINCHGGVYAMRRILETCLKCGARLADPGEFTKRAFLNGRIGLSQAEAVMDVIQAKNASALRSSVGQLRGSLQKAVGELRSALLYETATIESALDDPEHLSLDGYAARLEKTVGACIGKLDRILAAANIGKWVKEGIRTAIIGKPNVGKSSFLNVLLGEERAIVTEIAGTTRDSIEEQVDLDGVLLQIADTAGIRQTADAIEQRGVERAQKIAADADLILYMVDSSRALDGDDERIMQMLPDRHVIVLLNKSDLCPVVSKEEMQARLHLPVVCISAKMETGIGEFSSLVKELFDLGDISANEEIYVTNVRQTSALREARMSLERVRESIQAGLPEDFFSIDLMDAYAALGSITGESVGEDLADEIFQNFCMGK